MEKARFKKIIYSALKGSAPFALFLTGLRYYSLNYPRVIVSIDEGLIASTVRRILLGELPYRDFHLPYGPGIYYLYLWIIRLFNIDIFLLGRLWQMFLVSVFAVVIYYISLRVLPRFLAFFAGLYTLFVCRIGYNYGWASTQSFAVLFSFIALLFIFKFYERDRKIYLVFSGIFLGLTCLFFLTWAFCMGFTIVIYPILQKRIFYRNTPLMAKYTLKRFFINNSIILLSFLAVILIPVLYFCLQCSPGGLIEELFILPFMAAKDHGLGFYTRMAYKNYLDFFHINSLYFPVFVFVFSLVFFLRRFGRKKLDLKDSYVLPLLILGLVTYGYFHRTPADSHWFVILPPFNILGLYLIYKAGAHLFKKTAGVIFTRAKELFLLLFIIPLIVYYFKPPYTSLWDGGKLSMRWASGYLWRTRGNHNTLFKFLFNERSREPRYYCPENLEYDVAGYIRRRTTPADKIYVFSTSPLLYYLADRSSPTKNDHLLKGGNRAQRETEEIAYLEADPPKYIILVPNMLTQRAWDYYQGLADYILANYYQVNNIDQYLIFVKKPG